MIQVYRPDKEPVIDDAVMARMPIWAEQPDGSRLRCDGIAWWGPTLPGNIANELARKGFQLSITALFGFMGLRGGPKQRVNFDILISQELWDALNAELTAADTLPL